MTSKQLNKKNGESGMMMILMAIAIVGLIGAGSLAIDIGSALVTKSELQNVADAASLAGVHELASKYEVKPDLIMDPSDVTSQLSTVKNVAQNYAALNKAGGVSISVPDGDVLLAKYDTATGAITATTSKIRAVRVTSRREGEVNGSLPTRLAGVLGISSISARATTAAALTPIRVLHGGYGDFPIGISRDWFIAHRCGNDEKLTLFPTEPDSCAGWHTFTDNPSNANKLGAIVDKITAGTYTVPEITAGETHFYFTGGTVESKCSNLEALINDRKRKGNGHTMTAYIPVYDLACGNVNQDRLILGFVKAEISSITCGNNNRKLELTVECGVVGPEVGEGGGANDYGLITKSPQMVY